MTELRERSPGPGWTLVGYDSAARGTVWECGRIRVISSLHLDVDLPDGSGRGPQWHVSVSTAGKRPHARHLSRALRDFGMVGAEEDNHHPGNARHFWKPVDPKHRVDCECKVDEELVVEKDGYRWTNPKPGEGECRGCELATITGRACPIHGEGGSSRG